MATDYRRYCRELIGLLEQYAPLHPDDETLVSRVRAAIDSETLLEAVGMEKELCNPLRLNGYTSVEQVLEADPADLMRGKGLGPDRVGRILASLKKWQRSAAFALRAAADQVVPVAECRKDPSDSCCERSIKQERSDIRILLRDIAFELEEVKS